MQGCHHSHFLYILAILGHFLFPNIGKCTPDDFKLLRNIYPVNLENVA